ncbi:MAG: hypothetical protein A3C13_04095 [Candidatus Lloydbacteria bacterium RIFCSPHIGHO2_02_FULL_50_11]|nr:MAG: hypothetical protein A3C13_04095 [Candidatus Lloydbacteria bacterium RIFCSPHIGHO2_02_FULL_50_11]
MASGKGTATELVKLWYADTPSFRFSDTLREFWECWRLHIAADHQIVLPEKPTTKDLQELSTALRRIFGENMMERATVLRAEQSASRSPVVVIEGIRRLVDIRTLMEDQELNFRLIYIEASADVRWQRHRTRNEKPGDADLTFEQFLALGEAEPEKEIRLLRPSAHLVLDNSRGLNLLEIALIRAIAGWIAS